MRTFAQYLCYNGYIRSDAVYWVNKHKKWCKTYGTTPHKIKFNEVVVFIEDMTIEHKNEKIVNGIINKIGLYYQYLFEEGKVYRNLFDNKYLEGEKRRIYSHIKMLKKQSKQYSK